MYQQLGDGLRNACRLEFVTWEDPIRQESYVEIKRHGQTLWRRSVTKARLAEEGVIYAMEREVIFITNDIIESIFNKVDWNTFYGGE